MRVPLTMQVGQAAPGRGLAVGGDLDVELAVVDVAGRGSVRSERAGVDELVAIDLAHDGDAADEPRDPRCAARARAADAPAGGVEEADRRGARRRRDRARRAADVEARLVARGDHARRCAASAASPASRPKLLPWSLAVPVGSMPRRTSRGAARAEDALGRPRRRCRRRPCRSRCRAPDRRASASRTRPTVPPAGAVARKSCGDAGRVEQRARLARCARRSCRSARWGCRRGGGARPARRDSRSQSVDARRAGCGRPWRPTSRRRAGCHRRGTRAARA